MLVNRDIKILNCHLLTLHTVVFNHFAINFFMIWKIYYPLMLFCSVCLFSYQGQNTVVKSV